MGILDKIFKIESTHFKTIDRPTFIKEFTGESSNINELKRLLETVNNEDKKKQLNKELASMRMGVSGEKTVFFELKNCTLPMLCLHDIRLEYEDLVAQIDFIIITKKYICVLETKQLQGDVNINSDGEFIRVYKDKTGFETKKGMYSPIEQNQKHINLLKRVIKDKLGFDHVPIKSLVVMANPKAIIRKSYASQDIQDQIIRAEKLGERLIGWMDNIKDISLKEETAFKAANFLKENHKPILIDYKAKFKLEEADSIEDIKVKEIIVEDISDDAEENNVEKSDSVILNDEDRELEEALRKYRNAKAKEQGLEYTKYHFVFSNSVIASIVADKPKTISQLHSIKGLGEYKIKAYGSDIIDIISQHSERIGNNTEVPLHTFSNDDSIREKLRQYRLEVSRMENIKAYMVFNNEQMEEIISLKPQKKSDLLKLRGFGEVKVEKYGDGIIEVLKR